MYQTKLARSEIISRVSYRDSRYFISDKFLLSVGNRLDAAGERADLLYGVLSDAISTYSADLDKIKWELSHIPCEFSLERTSRYNPYASPPRIESVSLKDDKGRRISLNSIDCYPEGLPDNIDAYKDGSKLWCLYPPELLESSAYLPQPNVPFWSESDSLVDWIGAFVESDSGGQVPRIVRSESVGDVVWSFYVAAKEPKPAAPAVVSEPSVNVEAQIYAYIREHSPVRTGDLLAAGFAGKSHTHRILKSLEAADKIERVGHGSYKAL